MKYILILLLVNSFMQSKIIEVSQMFNKKVVKVQKKNVKINKTFYGEIKIDESSLKTITTRFDGFVNKVYKDKKYLQVKKNDLMYDVYSNEVVSSIKEYFAVSKNARIRKNYLDKFKALDISMKQIKTIKNNNLKVYSKYDGFIIDKSINDGSFVKKGSNLFQIASFDSLWVIAKIYQKDLAFIKDGMNVKVIFDGLPSIKSKVDFIYPSVNKKTKTVDVRILIDNKNKKIFPGMFAKINIYNNSKSMLVLPKTAVLTKADKHYVFVQKGKYFEPKEVVAKRINAYEFEILSNLKENDEVIDKVMFMLDSDALTNGLYDETSEDEDW